MKEFKKMSFDEKYNYCKNNSDNNTISLILETKDNSFFDLIEDESKRMKTIIDLYKDNKKNLEFNLFMNLENVQSDRIKAKYINYIENQLYLSNIIASFNSNECKMRYIDKITNSSYKINVFNTINNDQILLDYLNKCDEESKFFVVSCLKDNKNIENYLHNFRPTLQLSLIERFSDDLKTKYAVNENLKSVWANIVAMIDNHEYIIKRFKESDDNKFKIKLIQLVKDESLKKYLVNNLDDSLYKYILKTNDDKNNVLKNIKLNNINKLIDPKISLGIELKFINNIDEVSHILKDWEIEKKGLNKGEIKSPVLHYDENNLKELYFICDFMKKNNFLIDKENGMHIHLGLDYLNSKKDFNTFLNIYANCENILYLLSNKAGVKCNNIKKSKLSKDIINKLRNASLDKKMSFNTYKSIVGKIKNECNCGLSFKNIDNKDKNTIEIKIPNSEINFDEILFTINLYCNLFQVSKNMNENDENYNKLFNKSTNEYERLDILLDLLFKSENEKNFYRNRFEKNHEKSIKTFIKTKPIFINTI